MTICVLDYGAGNLKNICRAIKHLGCGYSLVSTSAEVLNAEKLIIPGVGAFRLAMYELKKLELIDPIKEIAHSGVPIMGVCLGMQLLFEKSTEFGSTKGLGLVKGEFNLIPSVGPGGEKIKVPHTRWNELIIDHNDYDIIDRIQTGDSVYFVHSYRLEGYDLANLVAHCNYDGVSIPSIIQRGNIIGCQFHPEKSGEIGLEILKNFLRSNR